MGNDMHAHYLAVLEEEEASRDRLIVELRSVESVIARLKEKLSALSPAAVVLGPVPTAVPIEATESIPENLVFAGISVRWAVLKLMSDVAKAPMRSPEIAEALQSGGVRTGGQNFAANVSAVVSEMVHKKQELAAVDDGRYEITEHGREVWDGIRQSYQYRTRRGSVRRSVEELRKEVREENGPKGHAGSGTGRAEMPLEATARPVPKRSTTTAG